MRAAQSFAKSQTIKVAVRIRPPLPEEIQKGIANEREKLQVENSTTVQ